MTLKKSMLGDNEIYLGDKKAEVKKLTPTLWKQLFGTIDKLPGLIMQVMLAPKKDFYSYVLMACDVALDEVVEITAVLSGIDKQYISDKAGVDEIIAYLMKTAQKNNLNEIVKNVKSLLPKKKTE
ncbi:hypothetical protein F7732_00490 [Bacillus mesophilum]|uniref:Uncharacterized protein n=2 Tax=Bacillus mesophilum TaxID=1071718 RepID=A0A7V7RSJ2_9BACI|nr:hypothetical protein F7732_00490 [Bacillus mesophilum]